MNLDAADRRHIDSEDSLITGNKHIVLMITRVISI